MQVAQNAQALGLIEDAITTIASLEAALKEARDLLKGTPPKVLGAPEEMGKEPLVIDPAWFKNQTNRHLTQAGKDHLHHLLTDKGLNKNQAAVAMGIEPAAVAYWWKRWGL